MAPPLSAALMQNRPLLDPAPHTIVAPLILSNPLFHKCRISDHLHLVFQWGIHTDLFSKREVAVFINVYTPPAQARQIRKHEGHPARAPDGTIMEIQGDACPGSTGESVGPWDFGNVHLCEGYAEWSAGLLRTLNMALAAGLKLAEVNMPQPSREELEKAQGTHSHWLHEKPLHPSIRKCLTAHRDGIRDKLDAFLAYVDVQIKSESGKERIFATLREALGGTLAGRDVGEYNGVLGGMVNKIIDRIVDFIEYMEEKIDTSEAMQLRLDEVRQIVDGALSRKERRKRDNQDEGNGQARKKVMTADAKVKTEDDLTAELAEPPKPRKRDRKAKVPSLRKRGMKKRKEADFPSEKMKVKHKQHGGDGLIAEAASVAVPSSCPKAISEQSSSSGKCTEKSKSTSGLSATSNITAKDKPKEAEAEPDSNRRTSSEPSTNTAVIPGSRQLGTPPPPYSPHPSLSPESSRAEGSTTAQTTPRPSVLEQTQSSLKLSVSVSPNESGIRKQMTPAARLLDQILNGRNRQREESTEESTRLSVYSSEFSPSIPAPPQDQAGEILLNQEASKLATPSGTNSLDILMSSSPFSDSRGIEPDHKDGGAEESLFLPHTEPKTASKDQNQQCSEIEAPAAAAAETEAEDDDYQASLFNHSNTPLRASSYDLELPPPPESKTRLQTSAVIVAAAVNTQTHQDESRLFLPQTIPLLPSASQAAVHSEPQTQTQPQRQSSYDLDLPPRPSPKSPKSRLGSSKMPIDIEADFNSYFDFNSVPDPKHTGSSIFGGPGSIHSSKPRIKSNTTKLKPESACSSSLSTSKYIEIKDEEDEDEGADADVDGFDIDLVDLDLDLFNREEGDELAVKKEVVLAGEGGDMGGGKHGGVKKEVGVRDHDEDGDGDIVMCTRDEWLKEVEKKKKKKKRNRGQSAVQNQAKTGSKWTVGVDIIGKRIT
ncbi:hypothetical protein ONS95_001547 [Cadophora gregata]|uniref:uncharacterized protein n=1 Tax=Cadophora gregata TaxID=51156 RepID=UPI0026DABF78|nr:uncharacterized protein ONS95_001547 [Cadophora gregata]KAK0111171.1 hypothetical protein ONS95_001547 [Cadophora gregata]KAK0112362.1 hypothetical protein ONS96_001605 [Cadophora gregata f. sp. sojae]